MLSSTLTSRVRVMKKGRMTSNTMRREERMAGLGTFIVRELRIRSDKFLTVITEVSKLSSDDLHLTYNGHAES